MDKFIQIGEKFGLERKRDVEYLRKTEERKKKRKRKGVEEKTKKEKLGGKNAI